jgi:uncharacterized repeat protein (TIGR01451 family)
MRIVELVRGVGVRCAAATAGALCVAGVLLLPVAAFAESPAAQWTISSVSVPTNLSPAATPGEDYYKVLVTNSGGASSQGPVTISDVLPQGLALDAKGASGVNTLAGATGENGIDQQEKPGEHFSCALSTCVYTGVVIPDQTLELTFPVDLSAEAAGLPPLTNVVRVSGGGADSASLSEPTTVSEDPAGFEIPSGAATTGLSTAQAGAHPDITNTFGFSSANAGGSLAGEPKNLTYSLPPGFAADFAGTPTCSDDQFITGKCPLDSQVGITTIDTQTFEKSSLGAYKSFIAPVYNIAPEAGTLATIGFDIAQDFFLEGQITLRPSDYGANVTFHNIDDAIVSIVGGSLTVWGVPAAPIHDALRWHPGPPGLEVLGGFGTPDEGVAATPYFTNPTTCGGVLHSEFQVDSWEEPGRIAAVQTTPYGPLGGCDTLAFEPLIETQPSASSAETPTGLNVNLETPQHYENAYGDVSSHYDKVKVVLPEGMTLNPSAGAGLQACTEAEFAYEGETLEPEPGKGCPRESKLGTIHARSPAIAEEVTGALYLAKPYENKFGSLVAVYVVARIPNRGVIVTAAGRVELNPVTGQITTVFEESPQLPISDLVFTFHQGATSPLVTPPTCGTYTSQAALNPWSVPLREYSLTSRFEITSGVDSGACPSGGTPPFEPKVVSGTDDNDAGSYSPFYLRIIREDGEQELTRFSTVFPPGITGKLAGIPLCPQADIEASRHVTGQEELEHPSCPAASEIGHTIVSAGVGTVLAQATGKVYLAGAYHGAGLSVVSITAAKVGPFDLGTVVIQFTLRINQTTAQVEVDGETSDPIPHIIDGIVVHVREIRAYIDREQFIINPTNCDPLGVTDTITGAGANYAIPADQVPVTVSSPFQTADCSSLGFKPVFKASTSAHTSRIDGASLHVTLALPEEEGPGKEANVARVKVSLPKQLPSPLKTLQKACTEKVFGENPGNCPVSSKVGEVKVLTPILANPLTGPAYFVSHGGAKYPELIMVLSGENGIQVDVHGETFISKQGITSATFSTVPDVPFSQFELTFPEREYPALTANGNLCKGSLIMPTEMVGQNGLVLDQSTKISVTGCPKVKKATHKKKKKGGHRHGKRRRATKKRG